MDGLLTLLLFAGLFFFMMRWGCGAHAAHGGHGPHEHGRHDETARGADTDLPAATDPVCGMPVAAGTGYALAHEGRQLRFCSRACLDRFESAPNRYRAA